MQGLLEEEVAKIQHLIRAGTWTLSPAFEAGLEALLLRLMEQWVERASWFGLYRVTSNSGSAQEMQSNKRLRKNNVMRVKESDFSFAWQTLKADGEE